MNRLTSKTDRLAARYIPKTATCYTLTDNAAVYTYEQADRFLVIAFRGSAARAEFHYSYRRADQRQAQIDSFLTSVASAAERRAARSAEKKAWVNPLTVGTILYTSWGYDQTNVEFYVVTKVSGKRVHVAQIAAEYEQTGFMSGNTWPAMPIKIIGEETVHIAQPCGSRGASVKISQSQTAWIEDGRAHGTTSYA